jgi:hypothetical protein
VNSYDLDSVSLLSRERHEQRVQEAEAERLARELRQSTRRRRRLRLSVGLTVHAGHRADPRGLGS